VRWRGIKSRLVFQSGQQGAVFNARDPEAGAVWCADSRNLDRDDPAVGGSKVRRRSECGGSRDLRRGKEGVSIIATNAKRIVQMLRQRCRCATSQPCARGPGSVLTYAWWVRWITQRVTK
jgi:hypothetical protein